MMSYTVSARDGYSVSGVGNPEIGRQKIREYEAELDRKDREAKEAAERAASQSATQTPPQQRERDESEEKSPRPMTYRIVARDGFTISGVGNPYSAQQKIKEYEAELDAKEATERLEKERSDRADERPQSPKLMSFRISARDGFTISGVGNPFSAQQKIKEYEAALDAKDATYRAKLPRHRGFECSACTCTPIIGPRFSCTICKETHLCQPCEEKALHPREHPMTKFYLAVGPPGSPTPGAGTAVFPKAAPDSPANAAIADTSGA